MRAALIHIPSGKVVNVVELVDDHDTLGDGDPFRFTPPPGHRIEPDPDGLAGIGGHFVDGTWSPAPTPPTLLVDGELTGDGVDTVAVAYVDETPGAPASVTFTVNGATSPAVPLVEGRAELALSVAAPGRVRIEVAGLATTIVAT